MASQNLERPEEPSEQERREARLDRAVPGHEGERSIESYTPPEEPATPEAVTQEPFAGLQSSAGIDTDISPELLNLLEGGKEVEPLAGMRTVEGTAILYQWAGRSRKSEADLHGYRAPVRIALGPLTGTDTSMNELLASKNGQLTSQDMTWLLEQTVGDVTNGTVYGEVGSSQPDEMALNTLIEAAQTNPDVPITILQAHGVAMKGDHYILTGSQGKITSLVSVIDEIKARDERGQGRCTIVISSCNEAGLELQDTSATLIYRTGTAGGVFRTGQVAIWRPLSPDTTVSNSAQSHNPGSQ